MTVAEIQRALLARGHDLGPAGADGVLGARTRAALAEVQASAGLPTDGLPNPDTLAALAASRSIATLDGPQLSAIGEAVLIAREGRRLSAYRDSAGIWTIGVGHTSAAGPPAVGPGLTLTAQEVDRVFRRDVERFVRSVREAVSGIPQPLPQHAFDALVSLSFNIGPAAFRRSTILRRLRAGDRSGAAEAILMWDRPREIGARRRGEYDQFRTPYETALPRARRSDAKPVTPSLPPPRRTSGPATAATARAGWFSRAFARLRTWRTAR